MGREEENTPVLARKTDARIPYRAARKQYQHREKYMDSSIDLSQPNYQMIKINNPEKYSEFLRLEKELYPQKTDGTKSHTALPRMISSIVAEPV